MDLAMPKMSGVQATADVCKEFPNARILGFNDPHW